MFDLINATDEWYLRFFSRLLLRLRNLSMCKIMFKSKNDKSAIGPNALFFFSNLCVYILILLSYINFMSLVCNIGGRVASFVHN